jgi:predicted ribosomally synthesized peptide with nif11-like leader
MSLESAREFITKLRKEPDLYKKAAAFKSREEREAWAKGLGYDFTAEELKQAFDEMSKGGELTDEELEIVAGGKCCGGTCESDIPRPSCVLIDG